jgi:hypothetical protein
MTEYSLETKARVLADYALGMPKAAIARKHGVPRTTVIDWCADQEAPVPTVTDSDLRMELGRLVGEFLVTGFEAGIAVHRLIADESYLRHAEPSEVVALYRSITARVLDVAEAVVRGEAEDGDHLPLVTSGAGAAG